MHCLSSTTFTEILSKSLLYVYTCPIKKVIHKKDCNLQDIEQWIHSHGSQILGFDPEPYPLTFEVPSIQAWTVFVTQHFDLRSVWLMERKIGSASCKIPGILTWRRKKEEKNCRVEPWLTRHMYLHVFMTIYNLGAMGTFKINFCKSYWNIMLLGKQILAFHQSFSICILYIYIL